MNDYIKGLLTQILEAHTILNELKGKPDDLDVIKKQIGKIEGVFKVICKKIEKLDYSSDDYVELIKAIKLYLENYDFYNVIEAYKMYDEDSARIRNMRTLVIRALEEKDLIEKIKQVMKHQD
jgi:hypothetical protein